MSAAGLATLRRDRLDKRDRHKALVTGGCRNADLVLDLKQKNFGEHGRNL
jgi:hypothetical protein